MFFLLKTLHSILNLLNSEKAPSQLAAGVVFGLLMGFSPLMSLQNLCLFLVVCLFRVNLSMFFLSFGLFSILAFVLDPLFDMAGFWLLTGIPALKPFWISASTGPFIPFFRFYNTVVTGSLAVGLVLSPFVFLFSIWAIGKYRKTWREKVQNSKWVRALKATPLYGWYAQFTKFREKLSVIQ